MRVKKWFFEDYLFEAEILPKKKGKPQEVKIIPIMPQSGKRLTKRQMSGKNTDQSYKVKLIGKDELDIKKNIFPEKATQLIQEMMEKELLPNNNRSNDFFDDLFALAKHYKEDFFEICSKDFQWSTATCFKYKDQFDHTLPDLKGCHLSDMTAADYALLQHQICRSASTTARKSQSWQPGDPAPSSAKARLRLLYLFLWHLKSSGICDFDFIPTLYNGKPSRRDLLLPRTSPVRSFPPKLIQMLLNVLGDDLQAKLLLECGLRIREAAGLLWCNLTVHETSQGPAYVLQITGQLDNNGHYVEYGKSKAAYRSLAVSEQLGEKLMARRKKLEEQIGQDLSLYYMCGYVENGSYISTAAFRKKYVRELERKISDFLRSDENICYFNSQVKYIIPNDPHAEKITQLRCLYDSLTPHSLRRNMVTSCYTSSGLPSLESYLQIGHTPKNLPILPVLGGKTESEKVQMCLNRFVSSTPFHGQQALHYDLAGEFHCTEVSACDLELTGHTGQCIKLTVYPTELDTQICLNLPEGVTIERTDCFELEDYSYQDAVRFSEKDHSIIKTLFPFKAKDTTNKEDQ